MHILWVGGVKTPRSDSLVARRWIIIPWMMEMSTGHVNFHGNKLSDFLGLFPWLY